MHFYVELIEKVSFSGSKISSISRCECLISARACCMRKPLRSLCKKPLHSGIELVCEFPKQCLIISKTLFWLVSYIVSACLASLQKFLKGKSDAYE